MAASFLQYMLPGAPSTYYGDEAGMEGHKDPFNRRTYPWGNENVALLSHYRKLGQLRKSTALRLGDTEFISAENGHIAFIRKNDQEQLKIYVNLNDRSWELPAGKVLYAQGLEEGGLQQLGFCVMEI
jgi:glycosidase